MKRNLILMIAAGTLALAGCGQLNVTNSAPGANQPGQANTGTASLNLGNTGYSVVAKDEQGSTVPLQGDKVELPAGDYTFVFSKENHVSIAINVTIVANVTVVVNAPEPKPEKPDRDKTKGHLQIDIDASFVIVVKTGQGQVIEDWKNGLTPGDYTVEFRKGGVLVARANVTIKVGVTVIVLAPTNEPGGGTPDTPATGSIKFSVDISGYVVVVKDSSGKVYTDLNKLPAGTYSITFSKQGYVSQVVSVTVKVNVTVTVTVPELQPEPATPATGSIKFSVDISALVGIEIVVTDSSGKVHTDYSKLPVGEYTVTFRKAGLVLASVKITVVANVSVTVQVPAVVTQ